MQGLCLGGSLCPNSSNNYTWYRRTSGVLVRYCFLYVGFLYLCSWSYSWTRQEEREGGSERWIKEKKEKWLLESGLNLVHTGFAVFNPCWLFFTVLKWCKWSIWNEQAGSQASTFSFLSFSVLLSFPFPLFLSVLLGPFNPPLPSLSPLLPCLSLSSLPRSRFAWKWVTQPQTAPFLKDGGWSRREGREGRGREMEKRRVT